MAVVARIRPLDVCVAEDTMKILGFEKCSTPDIGQEYYREFDNRKNPDKSYVVGYLTALEKLGIIRHGGWSLTYKN